MTEDRTLQEERTDANNTFVVQIRCRHNGTWQGTVSCESAGLSGNFRSALELVRMMDKALDSGSACFEISEDL